MADTKPLKIDRTGTVTITKAGIRVEGFETRNASCREHAILAAAWAIGELQRELARAIKAPGAGKITLD